jgi:hypothetical protein
LRRGVAPIYAIAMRAETAGAGPDEPGGREAAIQVGEHVAADLQAMLDALQDAEHARSGGIVEMLGLRAWLVLRRARKIADRARMRLRRFSQELRRLEGEAPRDIRSSLRWLSIEGPLGQLTPFSDAEQIAGVRRRMRIVLSRVRTTVNVLKRGGAGTTA